MRVLGVQMAGDAIRQHAEIEQRVDNKLEASLLRVEKQLEMLQLRIDNMLLENSNGRRKR
jgi:hypothetical protein